MNYSEKLFKEYREIYTNYNHDTLEKAVENHPELVKEIIKQEDVRPITRAYALFALGALTKEENYNFIKFYCHHYSPFMREAAWGSLCDYYYEDKEKYEEVLSLMEKALEYEEGEGVIEKLNSLIDFLKDYS